MNSPLVTRALTKQFGDHLALNALTLEIPAGRIVGLLGRNGAGKSTLINLACGLLLPTSGSCLTLGQASGDLDVPQLEHLGAVFQEGRFLDWMTVRQHLDYTASFYSKWDVSRERRLLDELDLDVSRKIIQLSAGDQQKLGVILGVCHHPALILLDEPISALDPIVRTRLLASFVDFVREDGCTIVISSHQLTDVEKIIDWAVCLDRGELALSLPFDEVLENYEEWIITSATATLPPRFPEPWVLSSHGDAQQARLRVRTPDEAAARLFTTTYGVPIVRRHLNLDELFPLLIQERRRAA